MRFLRLKCNEAVLNVCSSKPICVEAIEQQEFEIFYQPIIDLRSKKMIGMEALSRWNHPVQGLISPAEFIPVAEETKSDPAAGHDGCLTRLAGRPGSGRSIGGTEPTWR